MNPLLLVDAYKVNHNRMYPEGMTKLYSNLTPRKSRIKGINSVVVFGMQHFVQKYLIDMFNKEFFLKDISDIIVEYKEENNIEVGHILKLHKLGYLPLHIKALPEGSLCPIGVPMMTITNTHPDFGWLVNYLETLLSCSLWQMTTSATIAHQYKKLLDEYAIKTTGSTEGVQWQGHDFAMRGLSSVESAIYSGMGHLLSFTGTDTIPAIYELKNYYGATGLIGASVPATEHSVMCMGTKESELETVRRLMRTYPTGILSVVMDTWDITKVVKPDSDGTLVQLKEDIMARDGKLVIRPDSGDPADIICGKSILQFDAQQMRAYYPEFYRKGLIECLWDIFGGTVNDKGYKVLDPHIGAIYGDSITIERAEDICRRLEEKGFASTNIVLGIGSYTYQYNTRDTFGFAMKATYGEITYCPEHQTNDCACIDKLVEEREIYKDPVTDDGMKKSAKGLIRVEEVWAPDGNGRPVTSKYVLVDQATREMEQGGALQTIFIDGAKMNLTNLDKIRTRLNP